MEEHRCPFCNKLLFKANFIGKIEIQCTRCKKINNIECQEHQSN